MFSPALYPPSLPLHQYDAVEIHPVREIQDEGGQIAVEQCDIDQAQFWSCYLHLVEGGVECVADLRSKMHARLHGALLEQLLDDPAIVSRRSEIAVSSINNGRQVSRAAHVRTQ